MIRLESCHSSSLLRALKGPLDDAAIRQLLHTDAALCAALLESRAHEEHGAAVSFDSLVEAARQSALDAALARIALSRLQGNGTPDLDTPLRQARIRAGLARALAIQLGYPEIEQAYLAALVLRADQRAAPAPAAADGMVERFARWGLPVAAQDALRYQQVPIAELEGLHLLTLLLRIADDYSDPAPRSRCPASPLLDEILASAIEKAQEELPTVSRVELESAICKRLAPSSPLSTDTDTQPRWMNLLQTQLGPVPLSFCAVDATGSVLRGADPSSALHHLQIPLSSHQSLIAAAFTEQQARISGDAAEQTCRIDEQIARLMQRPCLLAIPQPGGVWVVGLEESQLADWQEHQDALIEALRADTKTPAPAAEPEPVLSLRFCREVLHEASAPLTTVRNYLHLLSQKMPESAHDDLSLMRMELDRLGGILQQLREVQPSIATGLRGLNPCVRDTVRGLQLGRATAVALETDLDDALEDQAASAAAIQQIIINLVQNALDSEPPPSRITILTRRVLPMTVPPTALLEISDDGPGLPDDVQSQLLQAKSHVAPGHAGLGLSIVGKLAADAGGQVQCFSSPGGTRFQVLIPVHPTGTPS